MKLHATQLPCPEAEFLQALADYRAAREAHKSTVGVPSPFPQFEILRTVVDRGEEVEIERDQLQEEAEKVNRDALAELDELKAKVAELQALRDKVAVLEAASREAVKV